MKLFAEVFPVGSAALPKLYAWRLDLRGGDAAAVGGKLAYRLRKAVRGHWVWTSWRVVGDVVATGEQMKAVLAALWKEHPQIFKGLRDVVTDAGWQPGAQAKADFVSRGLMGEVEKEIRDLLAPKRQQIGDAFVDRIYEPRGWVVDGKPAVSVSVFSRLTYRHDLATYARQVGDPTKLVGLFVADKTSTLKGEITDVSGRLVESRAWLLGITQREEMQSLISKAPDDELVVGVMAGRPPAYNYIVSALRIVLRSKDLARFRINRKAAQKALKMEPGSRAQLVKGISELMKRRSFVEPAYNSSACKAFIGGDDVGFDARVKFGDGFVADYSERTILQNLESHGILKAAKKFEDGAPLKVGVVKGLSVGTTGRFLAELKDALKRLGFTMEVAKEECADPSSRAELERAVVALDRTGADILLGLFADDIGEDEEDWGSYHDFKSLTVCRGIPSQVVYQSTLDKRYAMANIVLGVVGKTGNVPYVRASALPYCDLVVGIDIARKKKERLSGSVNATAVTRVYLSDGEFLRYVIHDAPLEGETIPDKVLQRLFPLGDFKGKRVVVHRDGFFRGEEKASLTGWAEAIGAKFLLVEIIKTGTPRIYAATDGTVGQPPKGSAFTLSGSEAFLVSSLPPFKDATPQPLRVRAEAPFGIGEALNSILSLTVMHYGSVRSPRLPVTIHYSDRIAYLALQGIKPKNLEGNVPFWL